MRPAMIRHGLRWWTVALWPRLACMSMHVPLSPFLPFTPLFL